MLSSNKGAWYYFAHMACRHMTHFCLTPIVIASFQITTVSTVLTILVPLVGSVSLY